MKLSDKQVAILKSYLRGVLIAITPLVTTKTTDGWAYLAAVFAGVIAPAIRAVDKNDQAFGRVADVVVNEAQVTLDKKVAKPTVTK